MEFKNEHLTRQLDLIPLKVLTTPINIIGGGAIGSFTALSLAKMGFNNLTVFDYDKISIENMNCQFFRFKDIGKYKTEALQEIIEDFTGVKINIVTDKWSGTQLPGIVISAVDSMEVRKNIWDAHYKKAFDTKLMIDPRMAAETGLLYCQNPLSITDGDGYETSLYTDEEAVRDRCTSKSTMYGCLSLSAMVCASVKNFLVDGKYKPMVTSDALNLETA